MSPTCCSVRGRIRFNERASRYEEGGDDPQKSIELTEGAGPEGQTFLHDDPPALRGSSG